MQQDNRGTGNRIAAGNYTEINIVPQVIQRLPTLLAEILPIIVQQILESDLDEALSFDIPFEIQEKIAFNNVVFYRGRIEDL
jgi:hypothetical protein